MTEKITGTVEIQEDENGLFFKLPQEICEIVGFKEGYAIVWQRTNKPGEFILRKPKGKPPYEQPTEPSSS